jgi:hypothetical protein
VKKVFLGLIKEAVEGRLIYLSYLLGPRMKRIKYRKGKVYKEYNNNYI